MFRFIRYFLAMIIMGACLSLPVSATVVRFDFEFGSLPAGSIYIELFDAGAPITVANFLNYIDDGAGSRRYDGSFIHRRVSNFVVQGGGFIYDPNLGAFGQVSAPHITEDAPIQNEFDISRSNVRGTIAMAKLGNDPDSATSEWFINLADNSANLDNQNGGFTVFGQVLGNGMAVVDSIDALNVVNAGGPFTALPVVDSAATVDEANLITVAQVVIDPPAAILPDLIDLDYGLTALNSGPVTQTVTIQNIGSQDLVIGAIGGIDNLAVPFSFPAGGDNCSGQTLVFKATCTLDVEFEPVAIGDFQDSFDVPSNDANQPGLVITVRGTGTSQTPVLDVTPTTLDFGTVGTGQPQELTVTVSNLGGGQLQPLGPSISGADSGAFSVSANTCNAALLDIGQTCTLSVRLLSFSPGVLTAVMEVPADPGNQMTQVNLSANVSLLEPDIQLPESVSVPDIRFDATGTASLSISNAGADDLYVSAIEVLGLDAALFAVTTTDCIDVSITPQSQPCTEEISFSPTLAGEFSAVLRVRSNDPDSAVIEVPVSATASQDDDGVADLIEQAAPNNGDGNQDGIADALQAGVTSLPNVNGEYVTLETSTGTLTNVQSIQRSSLSGIPTIGSGSLVFPQGFFWFTVNNVPGEPDGSGGKATVTLYLPAGQSANSYFKFGRLPGESPFVVREHWYQFPFNAATQSGAEFSGNKVILHLVDGGGGDNDLALNGRIVDPGGPAVLTLDTSGSSGGGGGCSMRTKTPSGTRHQPGLDLLVLLIALLVYWVSVWRVATPRE